MQIVHVLPLSEDYIKEQSRLEFLMKLRFFKVCSKMMHVFYKSVMKSKRMVFFAAICWDTSIETDDSKTPIQRAGSVLLTEMLPLELIIDTRMPHKLFDISDNRC